MGEFHRQVQSCLPTHGGEQRVGALGGDDALKDLRHQWLDVGPVGHLRVGHDSGRIGIGQDDAVTLLAEGLARLNTRIVELAGLANDNGAGPKDENRF